MAGFAGAVCAVRRRLPPAGDPRPDATPQHPPGDRIPALEAAGRAFKGATVDYGWYIWNVREPTLPQHTRTIWLPTLAEPEKLLPIEAIA